jgi:hypothetical protein
MAGQGACGGSGTHIERAREQRHRGGSAGATRPAPPSSGQWSARRARESTDPRIGAVSPRDRPRPMAPLVAGSMAAWVLFSCRHTSSSGSSAWSTSRSATFSWGDGRVDPDRSAVASGRHARPLRVLLSQAGRAHTTTVRMSTPLATAAPPVQTGRRPGLASASRLEPAKEETRSVSCSRLSVPRRVLDDTATRSCTVSNARSARSR